MNILLGLTGSVASTIGWKVYEALSKLGPVKIILTERAKHFWHTYGNVLEPGVIHVDADEWGTYKRGDPILHIELRKWADILVIAPLSANTMAKMANGLCDNLLTSVMRAWDYKKPVFIAPAMNTQMWKHPVTELHSTALQRWGVYVVYPQNKTLACGDVGVGAMADIAEIIKTMNERLQWEWPLYYNSVIPIRDHPGAFGHRRKHDVHTGVDLYTYDGAVVKAMEGGTVVKIIPFTGKDVKDENGKPMDWWEDTQAILVRGPSGVIVYGEVTPDKVNVGDVVGKGQHIAFVKRVLKEHKHRPDIPGHSTSMLHIELYTEAYENLERWVWEGWKLDQPQPERLLNPTDKLLRAKPFDTRMVTAKGDF